MSLEATNYGLTYCNRFVCRKIWQSPVFTCGVCMYAPLLSGVHDFLHD